MSVCPSYGRSVEMILPTEIGCFLINPLLSYHQCVRNSTVLNVPGGRLPGSLVSPWWRVKPIGYLDA